MNPRQGNALLRRLAIFAISIAVFGGTGSVAQADESAVPTTQAVAYNAEWVPYLDPPAKPAAVCLVDSGVNVTPDTPADSPDGPILKRLSLDGGPGTAANNTWEGLHGTRMAFVGSAPINGWGAVGFWPGARIVSIRAMPENAPTFPFQSYADAVFMCATWRDVYNVVAINLSLACDCAPTFTEESVLVDRIVRAHVNGISVVAAAGNSGSAVASPANEQGVVAVAAGGQSGALCPFSNRGPQIQAVGPGCDLDLADPSTGSRWTAYAGGTSAASMTTSIVLALLRSYRPELGWSGAERLVTSADPSRISGERLDVERVFRSAGLGSLVDRAKTRLSMHTPNISPPSTVSKDPDATNPAPPALEPPNFDAIPVERGLLRPRLVRMVRRNSSVSLRLGRLPADASVLVKLQARAGEFGYRTIERTISNRATVRLTLPKRWRGGRLSIEYFSDATDRPLSARLHRTVRR
jgi:subtilisin family serine protease